MNTLEQYYIQEHKQNKVLVSERKPCEHNPFLQDLEIRHSVT
jgi:hypothetical protein